MERTMDTAETTDTPNIRARRKKSLVQRFWAWEASGVLVALAVLFTLLAFATDNFLSAYNVSVVMRQAAFVGLVPGG